MTRPPTLRDVAEAAGVGYGTASRAISGAGPVSDQTRKRVLDVAKALGYRQHRLAAGLRSGRSSLIALLIPDFTNEFYSVASATAEEALRDIGYHLLTASSNTPRQEIATLEALHEYQVEGIIRVPVDPSETFEGGPPVVELNRRSESTVCDAVLCDDEDGFFQLTSHLINQGHRSIAFIGGESGYSTTIARLEGFSRALKQTGGTAGSSINPISTVSYTAEAGRRETLNLMENYPSVTAIIAASPRIASGVIGALQELDLSVPDDISLASYSHAEWFDFIGGGVCAFVPPLGEMTRKSVSLLHDRIEDPNLEPRVLVIPGSIRLGGSVRSI